MTAGLPNDVLLLVGEELQRKTDRWNLLFASKHFHDLFLPLVYRKVLIRNWRDAASFTGAILVRPKLACAVRELDLTNWHAESVPHHERDGIRNIILLSEWVSSISHSRAEGDQWTESLAEGLSDAWIALMLPLLSQLRKLHLAYSSESPHLNRIMQRVVDCEKPFTAQAALRHLDHVSLHHREDLNHHDQEEGRETSESTGLVLPFFQLPSIRTVIANSVVDKSPMSTEPMESSDENSHAKFSSVTDIDLRTSSGNHGMEMLIASCAELRSFKYQHSDAHVLSHGYKPSAFYLSLSHSKTTLQTLWLDSYGSHYPFTAAGLNQSHDEWFGSLVDFTALREVRVRLTNLLDIRYQSEPTTPLVECLPYSLETLCIEGCEERCLGMLVSQLQMVVKNCRGRFPSLKRVDIEGAFRNVSLDSESPTITPGSVVGASIKDKIFQAVEPLHVDCAHAGMELHIHDRTLAHS